MKKSFQRVIATLNLFQGKQSLTIFLLAAIFALSACDDSSSASDDNNETSAVESSSSVKDSDPAEESSSSVEKKSSGNETTEKDVSSSSDAKSSSSTTSSSGKEVSSSSSKEISSSSVKTASSGSSSSSKKEESSSSSSIKHSSSSSVVPKSSSSVFEVDSSRLCTPGYAFCNRALGADSMHAGAYKKFTYEGRSYYYLTINGENQDGKAASVTVMAENLNVGEMVDGNKDQNDDSKIERYCYDNDTTNCVEYGGLYQWAEMMGFNDSCNTKSCAHLIQENHQGICPDGWRLLTYEDMYVVVHANGNRNGVADIRSMGFGGFNYSGYGLIGAGLRKNGKFNGLETSTYWFYPIENAQYAYRAKSNSMWKDDDKPGIDMANQDKSSGVSVRCVMAE